MTAPRTDRPYKLYTDACDYAVGAILVQVDDSGTERFIQYVSHSLSSVQRRWATIEKEAYAVVYAISKLRPHLYGADFTVYTDHKPLSSLFTKEMQNTKIQRYYYQNMALQYNTVRVKIIFAQICYPAFPQRQAYILSIAMTGWTPQPSPSRTLLM